MTAATDRDVIAAHASYAATTLTVDASRPADPPFTGTVQMGSNTSPGGHTIGINSRYLTRDGEPWLPVMGELHYTRVPDAHWDDELAKIDAAGVDIVSSYVIWRHHEVRAGEFDWSGLRDLRRFVQACARRGLLAFVRIGPWVHAEVRYGGLPDWVVDQVPTRSDDPLYLQYVQRFFAQIATQLDGLWWKDGGPIIGVQLENEYNLTGPQQGAAHITTLKRIAREAGLDAPLYTVTGWDNAVFPHGEVAPVFGGYPDLPWGTVTTMSPPNEVYGLRFTSRVGGDLGAQTHNSEAGDADAVAGETPFLGAEFGGGLPTMYRRRPVLDADDIAAMLPVQLGSGVNLYGYYMLHGGRNPPRDLSGQESTATGGYNDLPIINYDFQAPFGANGEAHPVLGKLRPMHLFLRQWGSALATCAVYAPDVLPRGADDLDTPRFSVRANGDHGFLFFNNHVRQHAMPARRCVQFSVRLATRTVVLPAKPIDIAPGSGFIWPIGLPLGDAQLRYATVQPVTQLPTPEGDMYVFAAIDGIAPEFAFEAGSVTDISPSAESAEPQTIDALDGARVVRPVVGEALIVTCADGQRITLLTLAREDIERLSVLPLAGQHRLILTDATAFERNGNLVFRSIGSASFDVGIYPPLARMPDATTDTYAFTLTPPQPGVFQRFSVSVAPVAFEASLTPLRAARAMPPIVRGGTAKAAVEPAPELFGHAAAWRIDLPEPALTAPGLSNAYLSIRYMGDVGRLFCGPDLIDDHFYNGLPWQIGVRNVKIDPGQPLMLTVLPLRADAPIYLDARYDPRPHTTDQVAEVKGVSWVPEYEVTVFPGSVMRERI
ncbi:beta-galactosidase [Paraburkholderia rhizosphaerae]|uniref:Beta-galactosidase n=1 Tax=Paraburkholderia rhizosphaerae TaxID=480658 RepID=A0A4R8LVF9_9BURK|nr:beta-galactosidase [Paraburkholderia rhizosphaerae]TDY51568.1 glycosyl hydrolase family 35 [Paraburkholderia rhizosphaerae]